MSGSSTAQAGGFPGEIERLLEHGDWLRRLAGSLVGSDEGAQDLVQETWIAAASSPAPGGVDSRSWLAGITRNLARNSRRKEARRRLHELAQESPRSAPGADEDAAHLEQQRRLITALLALPEGQRRAVVARYYDGLPPRTIAAREGVPVATVKSQIQRGLAVLRKELDDSYGSRRAWMVAFAPMASRASPIASAAGSAAGTGVIGAKLFAALAAAIVAAVFAASRETPEPIPGALHGSESVAAVLAPDLAPAGEVAAADASLPDPVGPRTTLGRSAGDGAATDPRLRVIARARETGQSIPTFEGWAARMAPIMDAISKSGESIDSLDQIAAFGEPIEWDNGGRALVRNSAGLFVYVASGDRAGVGMRDELDKDARELNVDLVHAPPLWVRLVDRAGKLVEHDALIKFEALLSKSGSGPLTAEGFLETPADYDWQHQAVSLAGGVGQCRLVMNAANRDQPFEGLRAVQTRSFHYDAPGVLEFAGDEVAFADPPLEPVPAGRREVKILMPDLGALEVSVVDAAGARLPVSGTASFQFRSVPSGIRTRTFEARLENGSARWPEVLAASQEVRVTLSVPSLGQTWRVSGVGPATDGATSQIKTQVPEAPSIVARLLHEDGGPLVSRAVRLVHGERSSFASIRFTSDSDGRVRFALPEGGIQDGPLLLEAFDDQAVVGFQRISVPAEIRSAGGDAGDWSVRFPGATVIHGRLEDLNGQPHPRGYVTLTRGGRVAARDLVGEQGEFRFEGVFGEETTLAVRLLRPDEKPLTADFSREPDAEVAVRPYENAGPVVVRLGPPQLGASVHARVDLNSFELEPEDVRLSIEATGPYRKKELLWDAFTQEYRALDVPGGTYSAYLRIRTSGAVVSWTNIEVGASGEVRDPRLYGISLAEHLRPIDVRWKDPVDPETGQRRPLLWTEYHRVFEDPRRMEGALITSGAAWPQLVLRRSDGVLRVGAPGYRTVQFPIEDVGEMLEVELGRGIPVNVTLVGNAPRGAKFGLTFVREVTSSLHVEESWGSYVPVPHGIASGDSWQARLPGAGRYRLRRHTGSPMNPPRSLDAWLMVEEPVAGAAVQEAVLDLAAPAAVTGDAIGE